MLYQDKKSTRVTIDELMAVPLPERDGRVWKGIQHGQLAKTILSTADKMGLNVLEHSWLLSKTSTAMWGEIVVEPPVGLKDASLAIGVRHGNMSEFSLSFAVGAKVTVCSNGMFIGSFKARKRHSHSLDMEDFVDTSLSRWQEETITVPQYIESWKNVDLTTPEVSEILFTSEEKEVIPLRYLPKVLEQWKYPPHAEFRDRNAWSLYNAYTEVAKQMPISTQTTMYNNLLPLFSELFSINIENNLEMMCADEKDTEIIDVA